MIGKTLAHYKVLEKIGAGGMGEVYRARDTRLDRNVALKLLPPEFADDVERQQRFDREAKAIAALKHPNIVTIHSIEEVEGTRFLTMELIEGPRLTEVIAPDGLAPDRFFEIAVPFADAVAAAHGKGVTHRDLKPDNVMLDAHGQVKVLDFGLAKWVGDGGEPPATQTSDVQTRAGQVLGTAPYMSPEQALGRPVDARSDVFSSGLVLYEMAAGRRAFPGETLAAVFDAVLNRTPEPITNTNPRLPAAVDSIIRKATAKNPTERYGNMAEVASALRQAQAGEKPPSRSTANPTPPTKSSAPRAWWPALAVVGVLVVVAVQVISGLERDAEPEPPTSESRTLLAVLPFENIGSDPDQEFFADGMTDEMITVLGRANPERLGVIARTSAMQFKDAGVPIDVIGERLGVEHIVEGSVRRQGNAVRISAKLIQVRDQTQVWSESFDAELDDIFALQSDVASRIVTALSLELLPSGSESGREHRPDPAAYDAYLTGRFWGRSSGDIAWRKAIVFYEKAVELDPEFGLAWATLAQAYAGAGLVNDLPRDEDHARARHAARAAFDLSPDIPEAHSARATIRFLYEWDWVGAEESFRRAISLDPIDGDTYHWYAHFLTFHGRLREAEDAFADAMRLDPLSVFHLTCLGTQRIVAGDLDGAERTIRRATEIADELPFTRVARSSETALGRSQLGWIQEKRGRLDEAVAIWEEVAEMSNQDPWYLATLGYGYARQGRREEALAILRELEGTDGTADSMGPAKVCTGLGQYDRAFQLLDQAVDEGAPWIFGLVFNPGFDPLHEDPRYAELLTRLRGHEPRMDSSDAPRLRVIRPR